MLNEGLVFRVLVVRGHLLSGSRVRSHIFVCSFAYGKGMTHAHLYVFPLFKQIGHDQHEVDICYPRG